MPSKHDMVRGGRKSSMAVTMIKDLESEWPGKTKDRRVLQNSYRVPSFHKGFARPCLRPSGVGSGNMI
jgi:hypothetical protein